MEVRWERRSDVVELCVTLPAGVQAHLPLAGLAGITVDGQGVGEAAQDQGYSPQAGKPSEAPLGPGRHCITWSPPA